MTADPRDEYRPDVDGLRAVAVLAVLAFHAAPWRLPGGFVGVDVFFVISGYLISGIIWRGLDRGTFTFRDFYARRIRRIFPALVIVLVATLALGWWVLLPNEFDLLGKHTVAGAAFGSNLLLWSEVDYFDAGARFKPLLHLWSLGIEEQFYLIWPLALVVMWRRRANGVVTVAVIAVASFALSLALTNRNPSAAFYLPFTRFWELMLGALLAAHASTSLRAAQRAVPMTLGDGMQNREHGLATGGSRALREAAAVVGATLIAVAIFAMGSADAFPGWRALLPTLGTTLLIAAGPQTLLNRHILANRVAVFIGLISYPLYLWHWPLLSFLHTIVPEIDSRIRVLKILALAFAFLAAVATHMLLELKIRRTKAPKYAWSLVGGMTAVALLAAFVVPLVGPLAGTDPLEWTDALRRTPECIQRLRIPAELEFMSFCLDRGSPGSPDVVMIGDSHANAHWPGFSETFSGTPVLMIGGSGCPFLRWTDSWSRFSTRRRGKCPPTIDGAFQALAGGPKLVILAARSSNYTEGAGFTGDGVMDQVSFTSADAVGDSGIALYRRALARDLAYLVASGHRVILLYQLPEFDFHPRQCVRQRPTDRFFGRRRCVVGRAVVVEQQAAYRNATHDVLEALHSSRITTLDPLDALCDAKSCDALRNGVPLFRDRHHLSVAGSKYLWARWRDQLNALAISGRTVQ